MKKTLIPFIFCAAAIYSFGQASGGLSMGSGGGRSGIPVNGAAPGPVDRASGSFGNLPQEMIFERGVLSTAQQVYVIEGYKVIGSPFLYHKWYTGSVTTQNNAVVTNYLFRYNVYNQTVMFTDGKDSLDIDEPVKEFSLLAPNEDDKMTLFRFIHSDQFVKAKKPFYLEVMVDSTKGMLLKKTEKYLANETDKFTAYDASRRFAVRLSYYYYDKTKKSLIKIEDKTSLAAALNLNKDQQAELKDLDVTNEAAVKMLLLKFINQQTSPNKAPF